MHSTIQQFNSLRKIIRYRYPWFEDHAVEQTSTLEYDMQKWWVDSLDLEGKTVNILNSGFGFFSVPLALEAGAKSIHLYDMDPLMKDIAYGLHGNQSNFSCGTFDIVFDCGMIGDADVWVNTSAEHNYGTPAIFRGRCVKVLGGTDVVKLGHINPISSTDDLIEQYDLMHIIKETSFDGQHMVIGI